MLNAFREGIRRALGSIRLLALLVVINILFALPAAYAMSSILKSAIGPSMVEQNLRQGFDLDWDGEFEFHARGLATSFVPSLVGVGPVLNNFEALLDGSLLDGYAGVAAAGLAFLLLWTFLNGGVLDCYRDERIFFSASQFFGASSKYFGRFVRLLIMSGVLYVLLFRYFSPWLFRRLDAMTRNTTEERTVVALTVVACLVVIVLLSLIAMVFDYAKISLVQRERRSALGAAIEAARFVAHQPLRTFGLYCFVSVLFVLAVVVYWLVAPGANQAHWYTVLGAFLLGEAFIVARLWVRLVFLASQTALFTYAARSTISSV